MAYVLPVVLGVVAGVFLLIVTGEIFYLVHWRKRRPIAYPRGNSGTVTPIPEGEPVGVRDLGDAEELVIDVTCAEYQIAALHQDLVEKLFPALGVTPTETAHALMGPTRMLFTITEETKEELEGLDWDGKIHRSRRGSRSKSMSDISLSPVGPLSPLSSTPFTTPLSSPDHFLTPFSTPTYSPLVMLTRSMSASPVMQKPSCRIMCDVSGSSPSGPPSPTRPTFPFLARASSPNNRSTDFPPGKMLETSEWSSPNRSKLSPNNAAVTLYSPPRRPFVFATPSIHSKQVESLGVKVVSPLRSCTYVYENGTFSPSSPSSPQFFPPSALNTFPTDHYYRPKQERSSSPSSMPPCPTASSGGSHAPFFSLSTPPSETFASSPPASSSYKPSSQRSSSVLFSSPSSSPTPALDHNGPSRYVPGSESASPTGSKPLSCSWESMCTPFILESSNSSV